MEKDSLQAIANRIATQDAQISNMLAALLRDCEKQGCAKGVEDAKREI